MKKSPGRIDFSKRFDKQLKKSPLEIKISFKQRLAIFSKNPLNTKLNNHSLTGKLREYRSINITGDWRALYSQKNDLVIFEMLGTHSQLYK